MLLEAGVAAPDATLAVAHAAAANPNVVDADQLVMVVDQLVGHAEKVQAGELELPERRRRNPSKFDLMFAGRNTRPGSDCWPLIAALLELCLVGDLQERRRAAIEGLELGTESSENAVAWCALTDARALGRGLTDDEGALVQRVLDRPLPQAPRPVVVPGRPRQFFSSPMPSRGTAEVALLAIEHLSELEEGSARRIFAVGESVSHGEARDIHWHLDRAGVSTTGWSTHEWPSARLKAMAERDCEQVFLEDVGSLDQGAALELSKLERWSLREVADLVDVTGYANSSVGGFESIFEHDEPAARRGWLSAIGLAFGIDLRVAAAQARWAAAQPPKTPRLPADWYVMTTAPLESRQFVEPSPLGLEEQTALLESMQMYSDWPHLISLYVLASGEPLWDTDAFFHSDWTEWIPYRASAFYLVALLSSPNGPALAAEGVRSGHNAARHAVKSALRYLPELDPDGTLAVVLGGDEDQWVRGDLDVGEPHGNYWTCRWCGNRNGMDDGSCRQCQSANKPVVKRPEESAAD
jgi:ribosomal protein L40E